MGNALVEPVPLDVENEVNDLLEVFPDVPRYLLELCIMGERRRCLNIIDAEREWAGDLQEVRSKIANGRGPRRIPGYNAPSEP